MSNYSSSAYRDDQNTSWYKINHLIEDGSTVLDIGCSSGNFGEVLIKNKKCIVDGIELDIDDATEARKKLRNVYVLNIETDSLDELTEKYEYIYFGDVIEHLVDPAKALQRLSPLFKNHKKAKVLFSLPNMSHISVRLMLLNGNFEYGRTGLLDNTHLHFYTLNELNRVFNRAGMEIVHFDPVIKDYPSSILDEELSAVGLKNTKKFTEFVNSTNASVYQLVGYAMYAEVPAVVELEASSPRDAFSDHLEKTVEHYEHLISETNMHVKKLEAEIRRVNAENVTLKHDLDKISKQVSVKISQKIQNWRKGRKV